MKKFLIAAALAAALIAGASANQAEAKVYPTEVDGKMYGVDYGIHAKDTKVGWQEDGQFHELRYTDETMSAVEETVDGKVISKQAKKVRKSAGNKAATSTSCATAPKAATVAVAPIAGVSSTPPQPLLVKFVDWAFSPILEFVGLKQTSAQRLVAVAKSAPMTGANVKVATVATVKAALRAKKAKRAVKKRAPPSPKPCEPEIKVMSIPALKPVEVATSKKILPAHSAPARDMAEVVPIPSGPVIATKPPTCQIQEVEYLLFDQRGYEELRQIARDFQREECGELIVQDIQDRAREHKVPKARFFERRSLEGQPVFYRPLMMVPTMELLKLSETRRVPSSPGFQIKKKKG